MLGRARSRLGLIVLPLGAMLIGGCQFGPREYGLYIPDNTHDRFQLLAFVPCGLTIQALPDGPYYAVTSMRLAPEWVWAYDVALANGEKHGTARVTFTFRQSGSNTESVAAPGADFPISCAALVQLPWSKAGSPVTPPDTPEKIRSRARPVVDLEPWLLAGQVAILAIGMWLVWFGVRTRPRPSLRLSVSFASAALVLCGSGLAAIICVFWRWSAINKALDFYIFFHRLPRAPNGILPLSLEQVQHLLTGPPGPIQFDLEFSIYVWIAGLATWVWLLLHADVIAKGLYWLCSPLPTEQLWRRAMTEGTGASPDDLWGALESTLTNKTPWQIDIHRQKASNFMRKLGNQKELSENKATGEQKTEILPVVSHADVITQVQRRITEASNVTGFFESLRFEARADNAAYAMRAQVAHAQAVVACVDEHAKVLAAMDRFFEATLQTQMRRDLAAEIYSSRAQDERDRFVEAEHKRDLARLRREKERFEAERETISARHGVEAERKFKAVKFALGKQRLAGRIAEAHVSVAVARTAAGEPSTWEPSLTTNEPTEVSILHGLIEKKQQQIDEYEADGKDTNEQRDQLAKLKDALASITAP